ncbi:MAG TPA: type II toxin-antitoxin system VapC family toxin [archaeon]|nr:type II toxin-antitoxin system VapC family toxin [archaeon]
MYFLDANILFEVLFNRKKADECEKLLNLIENEEIRAIASAFSIYAICIYGSKNEGSQKTKKFLEYIDSLKNLEILNTTILDDIKILESMGKIDLDFDDALQHYLAKETGSALITLDADFQNKKLKTLTPKEALEEIAFEGKFDSAK